MAISNPYQWIQKSLNSIKKAHWYRQVKTIDSLPSNTIEIEGKTLINFASNDYLGLAGDPRLQNAAIEAIKKYGTGSTGSRLLTGHRPLHQDLEKAIATLKQTEDAILFSSGYLANLGTITALVGKKDLILEDEYNHSSLKNGAKLSGAMVISYNHCNMMDLQEKLAQNRSKYRRCLITTDTVFSMDGDICPVSELIELSQNYDSMVLVDEAHGTGVMGKNGAGLIEYTNCSNKPVIQMGTLSKALGSLGGYVAGEKDLIDFLRNRASSWIYTTALSPADTAAALEAINIVQKEPQRRDKLWQNIDKLKQILINYDILPSQSSIICLSLPSPEKALELAQHLEDEGIFAPAIRPPTVPKSRIRFTVMATHHTAQIEKIEKSLTKFYLK
jgi:8-amino-7-oxononanoate synthase